MSNCNREKYTFKEPFNIYNDLELTLESKRSIPEMIQDSGEILNAIYIANRLTKEQYDLDVKNGIKIAVFMTPTGNLLYVPKTYYTEQEDFSFTPYSHVVIGVELGFIPDNFKTQLPNLLIEIKDLVENHIGITPSNKDYTVNTTTKTEDEHNAFLASSLVKQTKENTQMKILRLKALVTKLEKDNEDLKCVIKAKVNV